MKINSFLILCAVALLWTACSENKTDIKQSKNEKTPNGLETESSVEGGEFEDYMALTDNNDSLVRASTMYYAKDPEKSGETYQVYLALDNESNIVRIKEQYTRTNGGSLLSTFHYYRDGVRIASKEIYNEGSGTEERFYERVTYYNEKEEPLTSKIRSAQFEEYLENEMFRVIDPISAPVDKAERALGGVGEFTTNFIGVIEQGGLYYIQVGEGAKDGFSSSLVVQQVTPLVQDMISNPNAYKGKEVDVDFREMPDGQGYTFQALLGISLAEE